jgi:hypothetical protein
MPVPPMTKMVVAMASDPKTGRAASLLKRGGRGGVNALADEAHVLEDVLVFKL